MKLNTVAFEEFFFCLFTNAAIPFSVPLCRPYVLVKLFFCETFISSIFRSHRQDFQVVLFFLSIFVYCLSRVWIKLFNLSPVASYFPLLTLSPSSSIFFLPPFFVRFSFTLKFRGRPPPSFFPGHKTMATFARMCTIFLLFSPLPPCSFFPRPCHACSFLYFSATVIGYKNASRLICLPPETPPAAGRSVIRLICRGPPRDLFVVAWLIFGLRERTFI